MLNLKSIDFPNDMHVLSKPYMKVNTNKYLNTVVTAFSHQVVTTKLQVLDETSYDPPEGSQRIPEILKRGKVRESKQKRDGFM